MNGSEDYDPVAAEQSWYAAAKAQLAAMEARLAQLETDVPNLRGSVNHYVLVAEANRYFFVLVLIAGALLYGLRRRLKKN